MRPSRGIWTAWALALVGGLLVLGASALVLTDPCVAGTPCTSTPMTVATGLAVAGTALAAVGGGVATYLTVRRFEADRG